MSPSAEGIALIARGEISNLHNNTAKLKKKDFIFLRPVEKYKAIL